MLEMSEAGFLSEQVPDVYVPAIVASNEAEVFMHFNPLNFVIFIMWTVPTIIIIQIKKGQNTNLFSMLIQTSFVCFVSQETGVMSKLISWDHYPCSHLKNGNYIFSLHCSIPIQHV